MTDFTCAACGGPLDECGSCDAMVCRCTADDPSAHAAECTIHAPKFTPGDFVRVTDAARVDMIGKVTGMRENGFYVVRVPAWQADGYHLDVAARAENLEKTTRGAMLAAVRKRGW